MRAILSHLLLLLLLLAPQAALADNDIDDVADSWVEDEIGRPPASYDNWLTAPKDWLVGRQVSDTMGGILGRIKDRMLEEEGSFGHPNRRRGPCGSAAIRQASSIASDSAYSQLFRTFAGNTAEVFGAIPGLITNAARYIGQQALQQMEQAVRGHFREQDPEEYTISKSGEGCSLEMRVIWKKSEEKYKFMILGDCGCNEVSCWNFEDRKIPLGRFSVTGEGNIIPRVRQQPDGSKQIAFSIGRVRSVTVRADCCDAGQFGTEADPYWVNLAPTGHAVPSPTPTPRPTTGGGSRPVTGTGGSSGSGTAVSTPPATPQPEPIDPNDPAGIGVAPPQLQEPVNVPSVPDGPLCEVEKNALIDAAFAEEHKANRNAQLAANYVVDLAFAGGHHPEAPERLRNELQKWIGIRDQWIRTADQINAARRALQALETKPCPPPASSGGDGTTGSVGSSGTGATSTGGEGTSGTNTSAKKEKCPECTPIRQQLEKAKTEKKNKETDLRAKRAALQPLQGDIDRAQQEVNRLRAPLAGERGVGGESTDTATGVTTRAYDTGDGRVRITVTDANGNQIDERYRVRSSAADRRALLERAEEALKQLQDRKTELEKQIRALEKTIGELAKKIAGLEKALADCLKKCNTPVPPKKPAVSIGDQGRKNAVFNQYIEALERSLGHELSDEEIRQYRENPEELERTLGYEIGDDLEIELESANSVDGTNAFDPHKIGHLGTEDNKGIHVTPPPVRPQTQTPAPTPAPSNNTAVQIGEGTPVTSGDEEVPFNPQGGPLSFTARHVMGKSPCPQQIGQTDFTAQGLEEILLHLHSSSGPFNVRYINNPGGKPSAIIEFNCQVPGPGVYLGTINLIAQSTRPQHSFDRKEFNIRASVTVVEEE